jgi:cation diffusion facilitator family transporter
LWVWGIIPQRVQGGALAAGGMPKTKHHTEKAMTAGARTAIGSILIGAAVLALKMTAWRLTQSAALYSDALETVVNVVASMIALWAISFAAHPADARHPYGHAKIEFIAAIFEGVLIVLAALSIFDHAYLTYRAPGLLRAPLLGIACNLAGTVLNFSWAMWLFKVARQTRSPALRGDAWHLIADVATGMGVVIGFALAIKTGIAAIDPAVAALTAIYVFVSGLFLIARSMGALMDMAPSDGTMEHIAAIIREAGKGAIEVHDVRVRAAGRSVFVQFHLIVPGDMTVTDSHIICNRIENALCAKMAHLIVTIHVEPETKRKSVNAIAIA